MRRKHFPTILGILFIGVMMNCAAGRAQSLVPTLVQSASQNNGGVDIPSCNAIFPSNNTAGNVIIVAVTIGATVNQRQIVVTDTQGNTYYPAVAQTNWLTNGNGASSQIFYAPNIKGGSNTVTMTEVGGAYGAGNPYNQIGIQEYSGVTITSPLDVVATAMGTTTSNPFTVTSGPGTTTMNGELIFGYGNDYDGTLTAGTGFTVRQTVAGMSEDMVQTTAGSAAATSIDNANSDAYVMLMATFKPLSGSSNGPVLPTQGNQIITPSATLTVTNAGAEVNTNLATTTTILFNYTNKAALLADGWSFNAKNTNGTARNTETNPPVLYNQSPGVLQIPCDMGDLLGSDNNTRNSLFRNLSSNWVSMQLALAFNPATNNQQANLVVYQDDDNYVEVGLAYNSNLATGEGAIMTSEVHGVDNYSATYLGWLNPNLPVTNIVLRLARVSNTGNINAFCSLDGTNWALVGTFSQALVNPQVGIWVGGSPVPWTTGLPVCSLQRLNIMTANPGPTLTYQLLNPPTSAAINTNGVITWTPSAGQSSSTNIFKTVATDNQASPLSATNSFTVFVSNLTNTAPVLPPQSNQTIFGQTMLVVTNTATDASIPPPPLTYTLLVAPGNAVIGTNGVIAWTPTAGQVPSTNTFTTKVTDNGSPPLSATNTFTVTVLVPPTGPVLPIQTNQVINELTTLVITNTATDLNVPGQSVTNTILFTYTNRAALLADGWSFIGINPNGTPRNTETTPAVSYDQPPGVLQIPCDTGDLWGENPSSDPTHNSLFRNLPTNWVSMQLAMSLAPTLDYQQSHLMVYQDDNNWEMVGLAFNDSLGGEVVPVVYETNGVPNHQWVTLSQTTTVTNIQCRLVRDPNTGNVSGYYSTNGTTWTLVGTYTPGLINPELGIWVGGSQVPWTNGLPYCNLSRLDVILTNTVPLTYTLINPPAGASINANGIITWTPSGPQAPSTNTITTVVTDSESPPLSATNSFTVVVKVVEQPPVLPAQANQTIIGQTALTVTNTATDPNIPPNPLTYTLLAAPTNAVINTNGIITWTPLAGQVPSTNTFTTVATDNGSPPLSATNSFTVFVYSHAIHNGPVLPAQTNRVVNGSVHLVITNTASDSDVPPTTLTYQLVNPPSGAGIGTNGVITWTTPNVQATVTNVIKTVVTDNGSPPLSATNSFLVTILDPTPGPVLPTQTNQVINELTTLVITNTATDASFANPLATNTIYFTYSNRDALLADGWSYIATVANGGGPRNTEVTNPAVDGVVSYDQTAHPGVLQIPCDMGDLYDNFNNTRNNLFRNLPTNWISMRMEMSFAPNAEVQQAHLVFYQDDDNYVQVGTAFNGRQLVALDQETNASQVTPDLIYISATNLFYRLDPGPGSGNVSAYYSMDGTNWSLVGVTNAPLVNPELAIWVGNPFAYFGAGVPVGGLQRVDIMTSNTVPTVLTYQLINPPAGAGIDTNGIITWTPSAAQGAAAYVITTVATDNGSPSLSATNSFTVTVLAPLTVTASNQSRAYGQINSPLTGSLVGLMNTDNITASFTTTAVTNSPIGIYPIVPTLNDPGNKLGFYNVTTNIGSLTVTGAVLTATADNQTRGYGAANPALTVSYSGFVNGETNNVLSGSPVLTTGAVTNSPVGVYVITNAIGTLVATNYTVNLVNGSLTVTGAVLTATANNVTRGYGAANPALTVSYSGFVNGETNNVLSGSPVLTTGAVTNSPVGVYVITNAIGTLVATNYTVNLVNGGLTVTGAVLTASANNVTRGYGAANPALTVSYSGFVNGETNNVLSGSPVLTTGAVTNSPVGVYVITNTLGTLVATNYTVNLVNGGLTVTGAVLTATANNVTRGYGAANPALTVSYSGFVNGETNNVLSGSPVLTTGAVTNSPVGVYVITNAIGTLVATNYTVNLVNGGLTVTGAVLTASANNVTRGYGAANPALTVSYSGFVNGETNNVLSGSPVLTTGAVTNSPVGVYVITNAIGTLVATNYTVNLVNGSLTVTGAVLTATADNQTRGYGAANPALTVSYSGFVNGETNNVLSGSPVLTTGAVTNSPVGVYVITNTLGTLVATNYTVNLVNGSLTVTGAVLTATADNQTRGYGAANPALTVSYSGFVNGETNNVLSGSPVLTTGAVTNSPVGVYVITNAIGTLVATNYTVNLVNGGLTVTGAVLTATADNQTRGYGAANPALTVSYSGFVNGETNNVLSGSPVLTTGAVTNSPVGVYVITNAIGTLVATNYTVNLVNGGLTVTGAVLTATANNVTRGYGAVNPALTVSYSGFVNGETNNVLSGSPVLTTGAVTNSPVGVYVITNAIGTLVATNYTVNLVNGSLTVTGAVLTATADNQTRGYGAANPALTVSYSGFVNGETNNVLSGSPVLTTGAVTNSPVGVYVITNAIGTLVATNYTVNLVNGGLTVTGAVLTASANNVTRGYGAANPALTVSYSGFVNGETNNVLSGSPVLTTGAVTNSPVGVYVITNTLGTLVATNYTVNLVNGSLTVTGAVLTASANNVTRGYGAANPALTVSYSGFVNGETNNVLSGSPVLTTGAVTNSPVGVYVITNTLGTLVATNYTVNLVNGGLTVTGAVLTATANNVTRGYGAANPALTVSYSGFVNGETNNVLSGSPVLTTGAVTNSPVGVYVITNAIGTLVATNYTVNLVNGGLTVTGAVLTATANNVTRGYGAVNPALTVSYSGFVNGETNNVLSGSPVLTTGAVTNSPVGVYVITNTLGTLVATNYTVNLVNGSLTVTGAVLTATANNVTRGYGAANPALTVSYSGFVNGETNNVLSGSPVLTTGAVTNSPVGVYVITNTLGTLVATNYTVNLVNGSLTVTGAVLTATANNVTRGYGAVNPALTVSYSGFVNGETNNVLSGSPVLTTGAVTNSPVGVYVITNTLGTLVATNYTVNLVNGSLTVTGAVLTATADNQTRGYGAANPALTVSYSGFVNGETNNVLSGSPVLTTGAVTNSPVGVYVITNTLGTLVATNYTVNLVNGSLTVTGAVLTASANNVTRGYGAANPALTVSYSGFVNGETNNVLSGSPVLTTGAVTNSPVGVYVITNTLGTLVATNYTVNLVNGGLTVTGAVLTASANNVTRGYGAANPALTVSYSGFVNGETNNVLSGSPVLTTGAVTNSPVGVYVITNTLGTLVATNYTVNLVNGSLTVTGAVLTATVNTGITANNKTYDGTTVATISLTNAILTGVVSGDMVSLSTNGYTANFARAGVGTNIPVTVSGLTLSGSAASNYTLVQPVVLAANITSKVLTIMSASTPVITSIHLTNGVVTIAWNSVTGGIYRVHYINNLNAGGWNSLSPDVTAPGSTATQTDAVGNASQRFYRIEALNSIYANNKVYDGTTTATIGSNNVVLVGVVNGDSVSLVTNGYTANFASASVGTGIIVTVNGLSLSGASATNYALAPLVGLTANITPVTLTVSAANNSRTFGLPNPPFTASYSGFVNAEGTNVLAGAPGLSTSATTNSPPGNYPITASPGTLSAANYTFIFNSGTLTVVGLPQLSGVALNGNQFVFNWLTITGQTYQIEYKDNLTAATWNLLGGPVAGTGNLIISTNNLSASPQRFFRLEISP